MTLLNRPTFDTLHAYTVDQVMTMQPEEFGFLQEDVKERQQRLAADIALLKSMMVTRWSGVADSAYHAEKKDTGKITVHVSGELDLVIEREKNVEWDQDKLKELRERISVSGDDPENWIKAKTVYKVPEATYKNWTAEIQKWFLPARHVEPGTTTYRIEPRKEK